jgi:hypothetical protein
MYHSKAGSIYARENAESIGGCLALAFQPMESSNPGELQ